MSRRRGRVVGAVVAATALVSCGGRDADQSSRALTSGVTVRALLGWDTGPCAADQPALTGPGAGYLVGDVDNAGVAVTDADRPASGCVRVGPAVVTKAETAQVTVVRDDSMSPALWRVGIGLTDDGVDALAATLDVCARGTPDCPVHDGAASGVLVLVLGDELLDALPPVDQEGVRPTEFEFVVRSQATATAILTYGRAAPAADSV